MGRTVRPSHESIGRCIPVGLALGQRFAYNAETWEQVWFLYITVLTEAVVGLLAVLYMWASGTLNADWLLVPLFVVITPAFAYYLRYPLASSSVE